MTWLRAAVAAAALFSLAPAAHAAQAPPAEATAAAELDDPLAHHLEAWLGVTFRHAVANRAREPFALGGGLMTRVRLTLGCAPVSYAGGLGFELGGVDTGFAYDADLHVLGLAVRWSPSGVFRVSGGVGVDGIVDAVEPAARFPVEVTVATDLGGAARLMATATWDFTVTSQRVRTPSMDVVTAFRAGLWVRIGGERTYWPGAAAGGGPAIGILYKEWQGTRYVGVGLALGYSGSQEKVR